MSNTPLAGTAPASRPWLHDGSVGFLLAYGIPAVIGSAWLARAVSWPSLAFLCPLVAGYVLVPIVQDIRPRAPRPVSDAVARSPFWRRYYRWLLLLTVPPQLAMIYVAGSYWCSGSLGLAGRIGLVITTGMFSAMFGITIGHELIHRRQRLDRAVGGVLLSTVAFGTFKIVHLAVHHRYVGTARDFATARRGQSIYSFWRQSLVGNVREAVRCDREKRRRRGLPWWRSELLAWYGLTGIFMSPTVLWWGWRGGLFFLAQSLVAILKLECINYLQHYGLTRRSAADGRPEAVGSQHAWSQGLFLHDLLLVNLPRHADHHLNPRRSYESLRHDPRAPQYPHNYALMILLLLMPTLFRRVVHPHLDRFYEPSVAA